MLWIQILISAIDESQTKLRYCIQKLEEVQLAIRLKLAKADD